MNELFTALLAEKPVLTDGAWGTQLQSLGLPIGDCPDAWNLKHPDRVEQVARSYVEAGSRVILTNTFGASRIQLERHGLGDQAESINRAGVEISRRAAGGSAAVFASIGPTGKMLAAGEISEAAVLGGFREQAAAMQSAGADAILIETMTDLEEILLAVQAANETGLPVIACMTFDSGRDSARTMMGVTAEQAAENLAAAGVAAVGANCGRGPVQMLSVCRTLAEVSGLPVWIKPNAGLPELVGGRAVYTETPDQFASDCLQLVDAGAAFIGGCCGTGPDHLRALGSALRGRAK